MANGFANAAQIIEARSSQRRGIAAQIIGGRRDAIDLAIMRAWEREKQKEAESSARTKRQQQNTWIAGAAAGGALLGGFALPALAPAAAGGAIAAGGATALGSFGTAVGTAAPAFSLGGAALGAGLGSTVGGAVGSAVTGEPGPNLATAIPQTISAFQDIQQQPLRDRLLTAQAAGVEQQTAQGVLAAPGINRLHEAQAANQELENQGYIKARDFNPQVWSTEDTQGRPMTPIAASLESARNPGRE